MCVWPEVGVGGEGMGPGRYEGGEGEGWMEGKGGERRRSNEGWMEGKGGERRRSNEGWREGRGGERRGGEERGREGGDREGGGTSAKDNVNVCQSMLVLRQWEWLLSQWGLLPFLSCGRFHYLHRPLVFSLMTLIRVDEIWSGRMED